MKKILFIFCAILILAGCKNQELVNLTEQVNIGKIKLQLAKSKADQVPITNYVNKEGKLFLTFEGGEEIEFDERFITSVSSDSLTWVTRYTFKDGSVEETYFIGKLNIPPNAVELNPYLNSPLAARVKIETPIRGKFKIIVHGKGANGITIEKEFSKIKTSHDIPILGLYENYENDVDLLFLNPDGNLRCSKNLKITTRIIANKPKVNFDIITSTNKTYNGLYFFSNIKVGLDQNGEIRWYYSGPGATFLEKLKNGNFTSGNNPDVYNF